MFKDPDDDVALDANEVHDDDFDGAWMMDVDYPLIEIALEVVTLALHACDDDRDDIHDDDYLMISDSYYLDELLMMMEIEPLLNDIAPGDDLVQLMHMVMIAMAYDG